MPSPLPKENIYAHTKKLCYILIQIDEKQANVSSSQIALLDFGCGNGNAVSQFLMRDKVNYIGMDIHQPSLDYARAHFSGPKVSFIDHIPTSSRFDIIIYADIIEHLNDPTAILREHYSLLNDDGIIVGAVPNGYGPFENEKRLEQWLGFSRFLHLIKRIKQRLFGKRHHSIKQIPYNNDSGHVQFFTRSSLIKTLNDAGFKLQDFAHGAFLGAPLSERFILRGENIAKLNAWIANYLPFWAVSTWYFTAVKK